MSSNLCISLNVIGIIGSISESENCKNEYNNINLQEQINLSHAIFNILGKTVMFMVLFF